MGTKACTSCAKLIPMDARTCRHCKRHQSFFLRHSPAILLMASACLLLLSYAQFLTTNLRQRALFRQEVARALAEAQARLIATEQELSIAERVLAETKGRFQLAEVDRGELYGPEATFEEAKVREKQMKAQIEFLTQLWNTRAFVPTASAKDLLSRGQR
jgi:hypothetical protein